jgi:hypothetical protein
MRTRLGAIAKGGKVPKERAPNAPVLCDVSADLGCIKTSPRADMAHQWPENRANVASRVRWSFRGCSVGGGHDAFRLSRPVLDARGTRRRATPRRWRERAAARAPLPRAALGVKASPRPSRRGIHRRPKTYCSGWCAFLNRLFARETLLGGRCRALARRSRRRAYLRSTRRPHSPRG